MPNRMNIVCDGDSCCLVDDDDSIPNLQPIQLQSASGKQQKISRLMTLLGIPVPAREAVRANYEELGEGDIDLRLEKLAQQSEV